MGKLRRRLGMRAAAVAIAATASVLAPAAAQAADTCWAGEFCAFSDDCQATAHWAGNVGVWGDCWRNKTDEVLNNGTPGAQDDVNIFWDVGNKGAYACLGRGDHWNLRKNEQSFTWTRTGSGSQGLGEAVHDNAASHIWVNFCGNNNF